MSRTHRSSSRSNFIQFRAHHCDDLIPGKLLSGVNYANHCHVSYNGQEFSKNSFEVLLNTGFSWVQASDGNVPHHAVVGGRTSSGENLYIGSDFKYLKFH